MEKTTQLETYKQFKIGDKVTALSCKGEIVAIEKWAFANGANGVSFLLTDGCKVRPANCVFA